MGTPSGANVEQSQSVDLPEPGSLGRLVYDLIRASGEKGITDAEIALKAECERSIVTLTRAGLVERELAWDSGYRRRDSKGRDNAAWAAAPARDDPTSDDAPPLVRDDVYVTHESLTTTLHAGQSAIRVPSTPGAVVEITTVPRGSDLDQEGGASITVRLVIDGSEKAFEETRNPFMQPADVLEIMTELVTPALGALAATMADI